MEKVDAAPLPGPGSQNTAVVQALQGTLPWLKEKEALGGLPGSEVQPLSMVLIAAKLGNIGFFAGRGITGSSWGTKLFLRTSFEWI